MNLAYIYFPNGGPYRTFEYYSSRQWQDMIIFLDEKGNPLYTFNSAWCIMTIPAANRTTIAKADENN